MEYIEYKGYKSCVRYDTETHKLYGKIDGIDDYVNFIADNTQDVEKEFHLAVDDYLDFCKSINKEPAKPVSETVDVDFPIEVYNRLNSQAHNDGISLSQLILGIINSYTMGRA